MARLSSADHASVVCLRPRVNQIERIIALEFFSRDGDRDERFVRSMQAAQRFQRGVIERLHAERDAVDAGGAIAAKARCLDAGWIGLERHLDAVGDPPMLADRLEIAPTVLGCINDGVPPPRKIEVTSRPGTRAAVVAISCVNALTKRSSSIG